MGVAARTGHLRVRTGPRDPELRRARVCYDHLAGDAAVRMYDGLRAAGKPVGTFGSSAGGRALALLRLDRAEDALAAGHALVAGAVTLRLVKPDWVRFAFPGERKLA